MLTLMLTETEALAELDPLLPATDRKHAPRPPARRLTTPYVATAGPGCTAEYVTGLELREWNRELARERRERRLAERHAPWPE